MAQLLDEAAVLTRAARFVGGRRAEEQLAKPKTEALLADAARSVEENRGGQNAAGSGLRKSAAKFFVAEYRHDGHRGESYVGTATRWSRAKVRGKWK